ncbi:nestin [Rhineura floridana]|uniref:nestin n=1 Tax=Rhineura floridana TaxID=261503 RepID=UPI002AC8370A|nr:nestin [Rhineura floridana]
MEVLLGSSPRPLAEESRQMWDLNKRLEAYLARVKRLEEENEGLKGQLQELRRAGPAADAGTAGSWRAGCEKEVAALRAALGQASREKCSAELACDALREEARRAAGRCQKERAAREEARRLLARGRQELEEERRAQLWLREKAAQVERELEALAQSHRQEAAGLVREAAAAATGSSGNLERARAGPPPLPGTCAFPPVEVEDYAQRLAGIWRGAVETYKAEVCRLEAALGEATEELWKATDGTRQSRLRLQQLEQELSGLKVRKEVLEESLAQQWQQQHGEAGELQLAIQSLEEEKQSLRAHIAQVLEDRQQLMHLKMHLSLEVATYRTLLEAESTRLQIPATGFQLANSLRDGKLESSHSGLQGLSLDRGHLGSRDHRPGPSTTFLMANTKPQLPRNQNESFTMNHVSSVLPKSSSPVAREFQKANSILQSQPTKGFDAVLPPKDAPVSLDSAAFKEGPAQQSKVVLATQTETIFQALLHESPPPFNSVVPAILEESNSDTEQRFQTKGESSSGCATEVEAREGGGLGEQEEEGDGKQLTKEPPGETRPQNVPYPSQLVTEALEIALKEVNGGDVHLETSLLNVDESQNSLPSDGSPPMEEESETAPPLSDKLFEEAAEEVHKEQVRSTQPVTDQGFEDSAEVNGGHEAWAQGHEEEAEVWVPQDVKPTTLQETELLEKEREAGEIAGGIPATGGIESYREARPLKENEDEGDKEPPTLWHMEQRGHDSEEASACTEAACPLGKDMPAVGREGWDPGTSHHDDHAAATGGDVEEAGGGGEDLKAVRTEALHLSEDEERRDLWSPSRENEDEVLQQAEVLGNESLQAEGLASENAPPITHDTLPAESCQERLFLQVEQEQLQVPEGLFDQTESALLEEEVKEVILEPEAFRAEEAISAEGKSVREEAGNLADEPRMVESRDAKRSNGGEAGEDVFGPTALPEGENGLRNKDTTEKEGVSEVETVGSQEGPCEADAALQYEDVLGQEDSRGGATEVVGATSEEQQLTEKKVDGGGGGGEAEEIPVATPEANGVILKGDLAMGPKATEANSEEIAGISQVGEMASHVDTNNLQGEESPQGSPTAKQFEDDAQTAADEQIVAGMEDVLQSQQVTHLGESLAHGDVDKELESSPDVQSGNNQGNAGYCQSQSEYLGSEDSLESLDTSPNASCENNSIEKALETSKQILLEETLPDHTPLHMYDGQITAASGGSQQTFPESRETADLPLLTKDSSASLEDMEQPTAEEGGLSSSLTEEEEEGAEEGRGCSTEIAPGQDSEETPVAKDLEDTMTETSDLVRDYESLHASGLGVPREDVDTAKALVQSDVRSGNRPTGETSQQGGVVEEEHEFIGRLHTEELGTDFASGPEKDSVFQADQFDPSNTEESAFVEEDGPWELGDQENVDPEFTHKVSPLTSVADLGEIVLEGEVSPDAQGGLAEADILAYCEDESSPYAHQISDLETCGREEPTPQEDLAEVDPCGEGFPDLSPEAAVSISTDSMKDADILEIVEQALEFNQELIKAAEPCAVEAELLATGGEEHPSQGEENQCVPVALSDVDESQSSTDAPGISSPSAKDPKGSSHLWVESSTNGLQQDPSIADFTEEILNGIGILQPGDMEYDGGSSGEEFVKTVTIAQQLHREEVDELSTAEVANQSTPQTLPYEETPRTEEVNSEVHEKALLDCSKGLEDLDPSETIFADIMQTACVKGGKDADPRAISIPPHFGDEVLRLEKSQHLKLWPEDEEELWSSEDN